MSPAASLKSVNWQDSRRKAWHGLLMLASAYAASDPRYAWAVPVITGVAGVSSPPAGLSRGGMACLVAASSLLVYATRLVL